MIEVPTNENSPSSLTKQFTTVTPLSKLLAMMLVIILPFAGFYLGIKYADIDNIPSGTPDIKNINEQTPTTLDDLKAQTPPILIDEYTISKTAVDPSQPDLFKYELVKTSEARLPIVVYTLTNEFGFNYEVSPDNRYIAILNYSEAMGDETFTIIKNDGELVKDFGNFNSTQTLTPIYWTENFYWLIQGIPIGTPSGVIRVDADTSKVDYFILESE